MRNCKQLMATERQLMLKLMESLEAYQTSQRHP